MVTAPASKRTISIAAIVASTALLYLYTKRRRKTMVTSITAKRGSEGMNLPTSLSKNTIDIIVATAGVVAPKALDITSDFYSNVLVKYPSLLAFFNPAHK